MNQIRTLVSFKRLVWLIGAALLLGGLFAALLGPVELYCFYLFSEGGRFHFEGFGFGSLMFGDLTVQIVGYYLIALMGIGLGYGHLKFRPWAKTITLTLLWDWLILGLPLTIILFLILLTSKDLPPSSIPLVLVSFLALYPILPVLLLIVYRGKRMATLFDAADNQTSWLDQSPQIVLVPGSLMLFFTAALHIPILFNGIFPFFGRFLVELEGIVALDLSAFLLGLLTWGILIRKRWAWYGSLGYWSLMILSAAVTLAPVSLQEIVAYTTFAPLEVEAMQNVPIQGSHLALVFALPPAATCILLLLATRHFDPRPQIA